VQWRNNACQTCIGAAWCVVSFSYSMEASTVGLMAETSSTRCRWISLNWPPPRMDLSHLADLCCQHRTHQPQQCPHFSAKTLPEVNLVVLQATSLQATPTAWARRQEDSVFRQRFVVEMVGRVFHRVAAPGSGHARGRRWSQSPTNNGRSEARNRRWPFQGQRRRPTAAHTEFQGRGVVNIPEFKSFSVCLLQPRNQSSPFRSSDQSPTFRGGLECPTLDDSTTPPASCRLAVPTHKQQPCRFFPP
jgi:hypothetical protein